MTRPLAPEGSPRNGFQATSPSNTQSVVRNSLIAGSASGIASTLACHPFDVVRVKMQLAVSGTSHVGLSGAIRQTFQSGGIRGFYTGLTVPVAAQAVYKATIFTVNNITNQAIVDWNTQRNYQQGVTTPYKPTMWDRYICGFTAGAVNGALFVTPVEFVRNQQISQTMTTKVGNSAAISQGARQASALSVIQRTFQTNGVLGLWRGTFSTVLRDSVGCGCFFVVMAYSQEKLSPPDRLEKPSNSVLIASGALAGVAFWLVGLPIDTMKTWIQDGSAKNLRHAWQVSQQNGFINSIPSLNRGWQVAYGRGAPSAAITVTTYSLVYRFMSAE